MARKRFTPERIVAMLHEAERGAERRELFRKHGISEQTFYRWKRMYGGLGESEVKRIKQLEEENRKLKQMVREQAMVIEAQREVKKKAGPEINRDMVKVLVGRGMRQRRACRHVGVCRGTLRYHERPEAPVNGLIREELRTLSGRHRRYGTPRMTELIRREGHRVNHKRYREAVETRGASLAEEAFAETGKDDGAGSSCEGYEAQRGVELRFHS